MANAKSNAVAPWGSDFKSPLGVNTKILLPYTMDSRWGIKGKESYLYSSVKLYRQTKLGNWEKVLKQLRNDL